MAARRSPRPSSADEQVKVIGSLRIGIPLYNVYLNEADEWSRRLATEVGEWALELNQRVPDSTVGLAHSLAGSSATVGFHSAVRDRARARRLRCSTRRRWPMARRSTGTAFIEAAEEIRRLLHQFAAGFLKEPDPGVIEALHALKDADGSRALRDARSDRRPELATSDFAGPSRVAAAGRPAVPVARQCHAACRRCRRSPLSAARSPTSATTRTTSTSSTRSTPTCSRSSRKRRPN